MYNKSNSSSGNRNRSGSNRSKSGHFSGRQQRGGNRSRRQKKSLDWRLFVKKAKPVEQIKYESSRTYADIDLNPKLHKLLEDKGFANPTEIQDKTLDQSLTGKNILGIADTGTGKTGAFLIPIINQMLQKNGKYQTLIVVPTRELANQVEKEFNSLARGLRLYSICLTGGTSVHRSIKRLKMHNHIVVGTPGRLIDMVERKALKLENMEALVLDEFDRMLDMGFVDDIRFLLKKMGEINQTMLFSATLDKKLQPIIDEVLKDPFKIMVGTGGKTSENVEQDIIRVEGSEKKLNKLINTIESPGFEKVLIFAETKRSVDRLHGDLKDEGFRADLIHGDKSQRAREIALKKFDRGDIDILIATDVAARGLDVKGITHVINYETPTDYENYIHRIGRTGRAGSSGTALTFID